VPARQSGSFYRTSRGWACRWYESGRRRHQSGFESRSAARDYFNTVVRPRLDGLPTAPEPLTLRAFVEERFLPRYEATRAPATVQSLRWRLERPLRGFGDTPLGEIRAGEVAVWEAALPPRFRHDILRALRMVGKAASEWGYVERNPFLTGANPSPPVVERAILTPAEVDALAAEMSAPYGSAIVVAAWCFLRPSELLSLERRDLGDGVLNVRGAKTARSRRSVPVPLPAAQALDELPARLDTRLLFPAPEGGVYALGNFRRRQFDWAVHAAGLPSSTTPYTLRHSGLSWALASGIPAIDVARFGGTSLAMLEGTYAHLLESSVDTARARMDAFAAAQDEKEGVADGS